MEQATCMRHLSRVVVRNSAVGIAAQIAIKLLSFGFTVLIVRRLGAESFGQYAAVLAFGMSFAFVSDLGLSAYAVREVARRRNQPNGHASISALYGDLLRLRLWLALLSASLLIGAAWLVGWPQVMIGAIALGAIGLVTYSIQGASEAVLAGYERVDIPARARVVAQFAFVCLGTIALASHAGYYGLIIANQISIALLMIICWRAVRRVGVRPTHGARLNWPALLRASLPFGIIGFTLGLSYKFDTILLSVFHGDTETGYYNAAYSLVFATVVISNVINTALYPSLTRQAARDDSQLDAIYSRALRYLLIVSLPIAVGGSLLADQIVAFLYGASYAPASTALRIIIFVVPLMFVTEFLGYIVVIAGNEQYIARSVLISTAFNIICNLVVVPRYGLYGAAMMTVLTELLLMAQYVWLLRSTLRCFNWGSTLVRPGLAAGLMGVFVTLISDSIALLPLTVALGASLYVTALLLLGVIGSEELRIVRHLRTPAEVT
jgi:O-antigen/teichoic acid export membrane protein